ncbi:MAG: topoisomerase [Solirubrobacteraceae bacterium]|nr:topoisomerase [Solirubrobacteraceae bacterium]
MARLRRSNCAGPGIRRIRRGKGFSYADDEGRRIDEPQVLARIRELMIPPAWKAVWICPWPTGHIQATGIDAAGRKQYLYHPDWRAHRDREKFDDMVAFARDLPDLRAAVDQILSASDELSRERVLAAAIRLLDRGFFRIGSEDYAVTNETYGLATMRKSHLALEGEDTMVFDYPAKSGIRRVQAVVDPLVIDVISQLKRRRGGGEELLAFKRGRRWHDIRSSDINAFIKDHTGGHHSAKDFRTWNATLLASVRLAASEAAATSMTSRKRAISGAVKEVARYLGNTPAVCRASYIDSRVIDAYLDGRTIGPALHAAIEDLEPGTLLIHQGELEAAVLDLVTRQYDSEHIEKVAPRLKAA